MSLREKSGSSRVICRDETRRDGTGRDGTVSINKQKLSCYRCERVQVDRMHVARYTEVVLATGPRSGVASTLSRSESFPFVSTFFLSFFQCSSSSSSSMMSRFLAFHDFYESHCSFSGHLSGFSLSRFSTRSKKGRKRRTQRARARARDARVRMHRVYPRGLPQTITYSAFKGRRYRGEAARERGREIGRS